MLQPKKVKFRRQQKGRMKGNAQRGHELAFGSFGIKSLQSKWITGRQIEAARVAVTRYMQRQGQIWIRIFPDKPISNNSFLPCSAATVPVNTLVEVIRS
jgi:large subunit ribosomal protein L16